MEPEQSVGEVVQANLVRAFNEWRRRYIEEPERFAAEWASIKRTIDEMKRGEEPSYGTRCATYLREILRKQRGIDEFSDALDKVADKMKAIAEPPVPEAK